MSVRIRRATAADAPFIGWVMMAASRGHLARGIWDLIVGGDEPRCLDYLTRLARAEPKSLCHYESCLVAEVDGHAAAALCGFEAQKGGWATVGEAMTNVQRELGWTEADAAASQQRWAPIWTCFLPDIGADWGIENVATFPEFRRRGLVDALMAAMVREGRDRGCKLAQITILIGNDPAQRAYEKAGFKVSDEKRSAEFASVLDSPGFRRLARSL